MCPVGRSCSILPARPIRCDFGAFIFFIEPDMLIFIDTIFEEPNLCDAVRVGPASSKRGRIARLRVESGVDTST